MTPIPPAVAQARARHASYCRHRGPDDPATLAAADALREAAREETIIAAVTAWPPLTPEQRARLAQLLL